MDCRYWGVGGAVISVGVGWLGGGVGAAGARLARRWGPGHSVHLKTILGTKIKLLIISELILVPKNEVDGGGGPMEFAIFPDMKRTSFLVLGSLIIFSIVLISWGVIGHRTVGKIAEDHLTANARAGVHDLLGNETLAEVSTWADEVRGQEKYRQTGPWHYINLPLGLSFEQFKARVENMLEANVYSALGQQIQLITDKTVSREQKVEALKFVVHFVGDLHQPMHVSRAEDKGGNTVQLNYEGQGTNLHALWDSKLIEHTGLDYQQLAEKCDHATPAQVRQWQSDPVVKWMWESYEITSRLYAEVDTMSSRSIGQDYYTAHWTIIQQRLEQAGIRLAGLLNVLFKNGPVAVGASPGGVSGGTISGGGASGAGAGGSAVRIDIKDAANHLNENVIVSAKVYGYKALEGLTLVNLGAAYPDELMTVVLRGDAMAMAADLDGKMIQVTGKIELFKGKPEIVVRDPKMVLITKE